MPLSSRPDMADLLQSYLPPSWRFERLVCDWPALGDSRLPDWYAYLSNGLDLGANGRGSDPETALLAAADKAARGETTHLRRTRASIFDDSPAFEDLLALIAPRREPTMKPRKLLR